MNLPQTRPNARRVRHCRRAECPGSRPRARARRSRARRVVGPAAQVARRRGSRNRAVHRADALLSRRPVGRDVMHLGPGEGGRRPEPDRSRHLLRRPRILPDGRVMVTGGALHGSTDGSSSSTIFDPATERWTRSPTMHRAGSTRRPCRRPTDAFSSLAARTRVERSTTRSRRGVRRGRRPRRHGRVAARRR